MAAPFTDFVIADVGWIQWTALLVGTGIVSVMLYALRPPLTQRVVLAFVPWMISGGILHVFWQLQETLERQLFPPALEGLFSAPAIYLSIFIPAGTMWALATMIVPSNDRDGRVSMYVGLTGIGTALPLLGLLLWQGMDDAVAPMEPIWPVFGLVLSIAVTFVVYIMIGAWRTYVIAEARYVGALVLFAHIFDGITTAIGVDQLDAGERSVIPRYILEFSADLPTAELLGAGWLFVVFKIVIASAIVVLFADYVSDNPAQGNFFFLIVAMVGLGPAVNNFFLFLLAL